MASLVPGFMLLVVLLRDTNSLVTCDDGDCVIDCSIELCDIVICTNLASSCDIYCGSNECRDSFFYLAAADYNRVTCDGSDSCKFMQAQCGPPAQASLPSNVAYNSSDFEGHINECTFTLSNNAVASGGFIECVDDIDLCQVRALTDNDDFKSSNFICDLLPGHAECLMQCNHGKSCGGSTSDFHCIAAYCGCGGVGCADVNRVWIETASTRAPTPTARYVDDGERAPTTPIPTLKPSMAPTQKPSKYPTPTPTSKPSEVPTPSPVAPTQATNTPTTAPTLSRRPAELPNIGSTTTTSATTIATGATTTETVTITRTTTTTAAETTIGRVASSSLAGTQTTTTAPSLASSTSSAGTTLSPSTPTPSIADLTGGNNGNLQNPNENNLASQNEDGVPVIITNSDSTMEIVWAISAVAVGICCVGAFVFVCIRVCLDYRRNIAINEKSAAAKQTVQHQHQRNTSLASHIRQHTGFSGLGRNDGYEQNDAEGSDTNEDDDVLMGDEQETTEMNMMTASDDYANVYAACDGACLNNHTAMHLQMPSAAPVVYTCTQPMPIAAMQVPCAIVHDSAFSHSSQLPNLPPATYLEVPQMGEQLDTSTCCSSEMSSDITGDIPSIPTPKYRKHDKFLVHDSLPTTLYEARDTEMSHDSSEANLEFQTQRVVINLKLDMPESTTTANEYEDGL